jgi:hypothetical protein
VFEEALLFGGAEGAAVLVLEAGWGREYLGLYFAKLAYLRWLLRRRVSGTTMRETSFSSSCLDNVELYLLLLCGIDIKKYIEKGGVAVRARMREKNC